MDLAIKIGMPVVSLQAKAPEITYIDGVFSCYDKKSWCPLRMPSANLLLRRKHK